MRRLACLALLSVLTLPAQQFPDASALIRRSAEALKGYSSAEFSNEMSTEMGGSGIPMNFTMTMRFQMKQGKSRMETSSPLTGIVSVLVTDGQNIWNYSPRDKHYTKVPQGDSVEAGLPVGVGTDLRGIESGAKVVRSETIEIDGRSHDCWVTESHAAELPDAATSAVHMRDVVQTVWYDKDLGMVLQTIMTAKVQTSPSTAAATTKTTTTTHGIKINPPLDDSLFVFTPPPDATETVEVPPVPDKKVSANAPAPGAPQAFVPNLEPLKRAAPVYPPEAQQEGKTGMVHVLVTLDASGNVAKTEILSGNQMFRKAAIDAVQQQTYRPIMRDGKPVPAYTDAIVDFRPAKFDGRVPVDDGADLDDEIAGGQRILELQNSMPRSAAQVFADTEQQSSGATDITRFYALTELAKSALDAGFAEKAQSYANEMLAMASQYPRDWNYGNAIYTGNTVLGLVALRSNNVVQAKEYLLASARTSGSPQLNSFGPDLELARELALKGEKDVVLQYIELCRSFWKMGDKQLTSIAAALKNGEPF